MESKGHFEEAGRYPFVDWLYTHERRTVPKGPTDGTLFHPGPRTDGADGADDLSVIRPRVPWTPCRTVVGLLNPNKVGPGKPVVSWVVTS